MKRKRAEEEAEPRSALFSLSLSKLHQSLRRVEPNLRHLVLVANTLRRWQGEMQAASGQGDPSEAGWRLMSPAGGLLLSDGASPAFLELLEDSSEVAQPLPSLSPEAEWAPLACPSSPLDLPSAGGCLLEDSLEGVLEDADTSVLDCYLWLPTSLPNFKEAFCSSGEQGPRLTDRLDCLMDVLVGVQEL